MVGQGMSLQHLCAFSPDQCPSLRRNVLRERVLGAGGKKDGAMVLPPVPAAPALAAPAPQPSLRASDRKLKPLVKRVADTDLASHKATWQVSRPRRIYFSFTSHGTRFWREVVRLLWVRTQQQNLPLNRNLRCG